MKLDDMDKKSVYEDFIAWMKRSWYGLPDSNELLPAVKARYSEDEAALLTGMPFSPKNVRELAAEKGMAPAELAGALDAMAQKGLVFRMKRGEELFYGLNDAFLVFLRSSFWPGRMDEDSRRVAPRVNAYFPTGLFDPYEGVRTRGLRAIPVETSLDIEVGKKILPYEDVAKVLEGQSEFCVAVCPCRHRKNLDPAAPDCKYSTENCLHFGTLARYMVENGLGRSITIQEARDILKQAAEEGLVHGISNWLSGVDTICNCCKCCCMWFESFHVLRHAKSMDASNFIVSVKAETCKACGLCLKRCPMEALSLQESPQAKNKKGRASVLEADRCIGCGVCAYKCPTGSLALVRRGTETAPPQDPRDYVNRFLTEWQAHAKGAGAKG
jgi:NAD-dependent dihydropyrimidine dehydrogenase PreA subunit